VNVTAFDLENPLNFDNKAEITSHVCFLIYVYTYRSRITLYLRVTGTTKVSNSKSDLQTHTMSFGNHAIHIGHI